MNLELDADTNRRRVAKSRVILLIEVDLPEAHELERGLDPALLVEIRSGSTIEDLAAALSTDDIGIVILGSGIDPSQRRKMVDHVLANSTNASIHLQPTHGETRGFMEFVNGVLTGLAWHQWDWSVSIGSDDVPASSGAASPPSRDKKPVVRRILDYVFGRSDPPMHPPPPPYSPGAGH